MLFHSAPFFLLFSVALVGIAVITKNKLRTIFLLLFSYVFYINDSPENAIFILFSTLTSYVVGKVVSSSPQKNLYLSINLFVNFGMLFFFKSYDTLLFPYLKSIFPTLEFNSFDLPLGLSFYTFQAVSYTIDIARNDIEPEESLLDFALYISFFPQLIAGPIERAKDLLPQLKNIPKSIDYEKFRQGALIFAFGLFKKLIIADRLGAISNFIFTDWSNRSSLGLLVGGYAITLQYYCDFSAYSEIALGTGLMMGVNLSRNFNFPFFATSPIEFWRRWHITLMSWFHDYLFMPILKLKFSVSNLLIAVMVVFLVSGIWHGVSLNYILWGFLNGSLVVINIIYRHFFKKKSHSFLIPFKIIGTFHIFVILGLFLYQADVATSYNILMKFFSFNGTSLKFIYNDAFPFDSIISIISILLLLLGELIFSRYDFWKFYNRIPTLGRWIAYTTIIVALILFTYSKSQPYVYYRF